MKIRKLKKSILKVLAVFVLCFMTTLIWAQDGGGTDVNVKITKDGGMWYTQPWVWVVGAAVFILLLVALLRGNKK